MPPVYTGVFAFVLNVQYKYMPFMVSNQVTEML